MAISDPLVIGVGLRVALWGSTLLATGVWISRDAASRESDQPLAWGILSVLAAPVALPYYFYLRSRGSKLGPRRSPPTASDRALATWASAGVATVVGSSLVAPPDPITGSLYAAVGLVVALPVAYLLVYRGGYRDIAGSIGA
jgi:hypothetical protein